MFFALLWATTASAAPYTSEPASLLFADRVDAFDAIEYDTGVLPSGSPLGVRFVISSRGTSDTEIPATSSLSWPEPLTQQVVGGTGVHDVSVVIEVAAQVTFDLWGIRGSYDVWSRSLRIEESASFDGLLLPGSPVPSVRVARDGELLASYSTEIDLGYDFRLEFDVDALPTMSSQFAGQRIEMGDAHIAHHTERAVHPVPAVGRGAIELRSGYVGELWSELHLLLRPRLALCDDYFGFCFDVARFNVPVELVDSVQERVFGKDWVRFPLPVIALQRAGHYFGEVTLEEPQIHVLEIANDGDLDLYVDLLVEGDLTFDVDADAVVIPPNDVELVEVSFRPDQPGEAQGLLTLISNDPETPEIVYNLSGAGVEPVQEPDPSDPDDPGTSSFAGDGGVPTLGSSACGCASTSGGSHGLALLVLGVMALCRRRRSLDVRAAAE